MKNISFNSFNSLVGIFIIVFIISLFFINYIKGIQEGFVYKGVGRWNQNYYKSWKGSEQYPVSINCNCPDNYNLIDTKCVSREYPFRTIEPNCYNSI
jgi:hypothetical protein